MAGQKKNYQGTAPITLKAAGAINANRCVELDSNGDVTATNAIADDVIGVAEETVASGEYVTIQTMGVAKLTASAAIAIGAQVMPTASGAGKVSTSSGATAKSIGIALSAAAADGEVIEVLLRLGVNGPANS